jgi:hypothetical protein
MTRWPDKGRLSNEAREKIRNKHLGKRHSQETKDKIKKTLTGRKDAELTKFKKRLAQLSRGKANEDRN